MAKKENKKYIPTEIDFKSMIYCNKRDIAFFISKLSQDNEKYYVIKYKISKYKDVSYMRKNISLQASFTNRLALKEYDALEKMFEYYRKTKDKLEGEEIKKQELTKPEVLTVVENIVKKENHQIDLLEMIADVEKENETNL